MLRYEYLLDEVILLYCRRRSLQHGDGLVYCEGVFYAEDTAAAALKGVKVGSGAEGFSEVTGECADICAFAACHAD